MLVSQGNINYQITINESFIVKGLAICAMLVHHLFLERLEFGYYGFQVAMVGKICVAMFVFLSGYLTKMENSDWKSFYKKRILRVLIPYVIWSTLYLLVKFKSGITLDIPYGKESNIVLCLAVDMLGFQGFDSYNITWWFNELILSLWLFFPLFFWSMKSKLVSIPMLLLFFFNPNDVLYPLNFIAISMPKYMLIFAEGVFVALHINKISTCLNKARPSLVLLYSTIFSSFFLIARNLPVIPEFSNQSVDAFAVPLICLVVVVSSRITGKNGKFFVFLGKHSMNVYLMHTFLFGYFFSEFFYGLKNPILIFVAVLSASLLLSSMIEIIKKKIYFYSLQNKIVSFISERIYT